MDISKIRIAIDGPSGAGKSTIAKNLAHKYGLIYVDTGALYRAIGLYMADRDIDAYDTGKIISELPSVSLALSYEDGAQVVSLNGENVCGRIRTEKASYYASAVSKIPEVRAFLLKTQRDIAANGGVIMDGRDIGTVIMPDAELKIFLTASPEERARRRYLEQLEKGESVSYNAILENIIARDKQDSERETAPLKPADDADLFVTDGNELEDTVSQLSAFVEEKVQNI